MANDGATEPSAEQLIAQLYALGVRHLSGLLPAPLHAAPLSTHGLLMGLAMIDDARLRSALVPLFLLSPECASAVECVAATLPGAPRITLQCSYAAAVAFDRQIGGALNHIRRPGAPPLPDLFVDDLGLGPMDSPEARLAEVAMRHAQLSGEDINWRGTYEHAVAAALRCVRPEAEWTP